MNIMMIAQIMRDNKRAGIRIIDTDEPKDGYKDVPISSITAVLQSGNVAIQNLGVENGELKGTNGIIDRYTALDTSKGKIIGKAPIVIVNKIGDAGYTVARWDGTIKKVKTADVIEHAKIHGLSNGKLREKEDGSGEWFISSIVGEYPEAKIAKSKLGDKSRINLNLSTDRSTGAIARGAKVEASNNIESNDVFRLMTEQQKQVIRTYYVWYTVEIYKSLAKSVRLELAPDKADKIAKLKGDYSWDFGGTVDTGFPGGGKCELGHSLRYKYYAIAKDKNNQIIKDAIIVFGETCSSDFFNISKEDMKSLVKARMLMSEEIAILASIVDNNLYEEFYANTPLLNDVMNRYEQEELEKLFGRRIAQTLTNFKSLRATLSRVTSKISIETM